MKFTALTYFVGLVLAWATAQEEPDSEFFLLCSGGKHRKVKKALEDHQEWANARTPDGETCLHLAAIPGSSKLSKILLDAGADPNARSTFDGGLRMHPLSWNVYGGHVDSIKLLLENGATVNADFDSMADKIKKSITVLDIAIEALTSDSGEDPGYTPFRLTRDLLLQHGAKTYAYLTNQAEL